MSGVGDLKKKFEPPRGPGKVGWFVNITFLYVFLNFRHVFHGEGFLRFMF